MNAQQTVTYLEITGLDLLYAASQVYVKVSGAASQDSGPSQQQKVPIAKTCADLYLDGVCLFLLPFEDGTHSASLGNAALLVHALVTTGSRHCGPTLAVFLENERPTREMPLVFCCGSKLSNSEKPSACFRRALGGTKRSHDDSVLGAFDFHVCPLRNPLT